MEVRRAVRSSSRRTIPAPQQLPKAPALQPARPTRRGTRSASRDIEAPVKPVKATRRSARQGSVDSVISESEKERQTVSRAQRKAQKAAIADLTVVEEIDAELALEDALPNKEVAPPRRSLGAISSMSGTTAISSFTMAEAELLEPRLMLRNLKKLHEDSVEFLDYLAPEDSRLPDLHKLIEDMRRSNPKVVAYYNDYNEDLNHRLEKFRGEQQQKFIHIRAVHAALFGASRDTAAAETGLDLILYQANLIILAKDMINTHRNAKNMFETLRELDQSFPKLFLPALILGTKPSQSPAGDSALLQETFQLALELRTQLAILALEQGSSDESFDPNAALEEVFFESDSENSDQEGLVRGWSTFALGGDDSALPETFAQEVTARVDLIRQYFWSSEEWSERGESVNVIDLGAAFAWDAVNLRLLDWVRLRNIELQAAIRQQGSAKGILRKVETEKEHPTVATEANPPVPRASPRKKRSSFGPNRRRSSAKFDPNAEVDSTVLSKLIAREGGDRSRSPESVAPHEPHVEEAEPEVPKQEPVVESLPHDDDSQPHQEEEQEQIVGIVDEGAEDDVVEEIVQQAPELPKPAQVSESSRPTQDIESLRPTQVLESTRPPQLPESPRPAQAPTSSRPPQSTNDFVSLLKETRTSDKENRGMSLFERQPNAQRFEFGDGFDDSEPTPGPSRTQPTAGPSRKGKEPQRSNPKKRKRGEVSDDDDDDDDDAFETEQRSANVQRQRANAPKRVRVEPASSGAPTSHQPAPRPRDDEFPPIEEFEQPEEETSEPEAPEMTEEAPPRSTVSDMRALARANTVPKTRRAKKPWTLAEEEALVAYFADYPRQYAKILEVDRNSRRKYLHDEENGTWIARRTQVDLKDKARTLAKNMIKSGSGLRPGFEGVITPAMEKQLRDDGFRW